MTHVYPDIFNESVMADYKKSVIERSRLDWYERVIPPKIINLKKHIQDLRDQGCDVRLTYLEKKHIEDVFEFNSRTKLPFSKTEKKELKIMNSTNFMQLEPGETKKIGSYRGFDVYFGATSFQRNVLLVGNKEAAKWS